MLFTVESIQSLAKLARLSMNKSEIESAQKNLSEIVGYIESLSQVDVEGVEPMFHAVPSDLPLRADVAKQGIGREGLLGSAGYEDGLIKVPKIIE